MTCPVFGYVLFRPKKLEFVPRGTPAGLVCVKYPAHGEEYLETVDASGSCVGLCCYVLTVPPSFFAPLPVAQTLFQPMTEKVDIYRVGLVLKKFLTNGGVHAAEGLPDVDTMAHRRYNEVRTAVFDEDAKVDLEFRDVAASERRRGGTGAIVVAE